jgi:purine-nucleoside phosphorylase
MLSKHIQPRLASAVVFLTPHRFVVFYPHPTLYDRIQERKTFLAAFGEAPQVAVVFGSGLSGNMTQKLQGLKSFRFEEIPHFDRSTVPGHRGVITFGRLGTRPLLISEGRLHYYEGYPMSEVVFPVRVFASLGIEELILTNASGGLNPLFKKGDLMAVTDHINLTCRNPLRGPNDERLGPRFPDLTNAYDPGMIRGLLKSAQKMKIKLRKGVYAGILGPSYETPAEIKMYRKLGGDAIGMSTVPEVIAARHMGVKTGVISCITNILVGKKSGALSHEQVVEEAQKVQEKLTALLESYFLGYK